MKRRSAANAKKVNVGFRKNGVDLLGFEVKITGKADIYLLVFERGHRRVHVSYHKDGHVNHRSDRPNAPSVPVQWDITGKMEPMVGCKTPPKDVLERERVAVTGWPTGEIEKAGLNRFVPGPEDILIVEPKTQSVGFLVNIIGPKAVPRTIGEVGSPILERHYIHGVVTLEIEVFDWLHDKLI